MKKIIYKISLWVVLSLILYVTFGFIEENFNVMEWKENTKFFFFTYSLMSLFYSDYKVTMYFKSYSN